MPSIARLISWLIYCFEAHDQKQSWTQLGRSDLILETEEGAPRSWKVDTGKATLALNGIGPIDINDSHEEPSEGSIVGEVARPVDIHIDALSRQEVLWLGPLLLEIGDELVWNGPLSRCQVDRQSLWRIESELYSRGECLRDILL